jgi:hypothetical protein
VIRLRQSLEAGLRHPLLRPLLLLFLALVLAFLVLHTVEHGVEGLLFSCAMVAAVAVPLLVVLGSSWRERAATSPQHERGPPRRAVRLLAGRRPPTRLVSLPLRL